MLTLEKFEEASEIVKKVTQDTKLVYSDYFSAQTGNKVYFKPENLQLTGAYKIRGAYYKISTLSDEEKAKAEELNDQYDHTEKKLNEKAENETGAGESRGA